jgi:ribosomal protein L18E
MMPGKFSFIGYPAKVILKNSKLLVPGIERVDVVYFDPLKKRLAAKMATKQGETYATERLNVSSCIPPLNKMRSRKTPAEWYGRHEIPYELNSKEANNKGVFGEMDKVVLLTRFPNNFDGENDLVFFYFSADMSNYVMSGTKKNLTPEIKEIIARSIRNSLLMILSNAANDQQVLKMISENMAAAGQNLERVNKKLIDTNRKYQESLVISCKHYLDKFSLQNKRTYAFSDSAIQCIKTYEGEFHKLERIIETAVEVADNLIFGAAPSKITLSESHLNFLRDEAPVQEMDPLDNGIYSVSAKFLNRLETGFLRTKDKNLPPTSKNVASALDSPVKPAAISYSVDYHKDNIKTLFKLYPDKWQLLKTEFKPIMKLVEKHFPSSTKVDKTA